MQVKSSGTQLLIGVSPSKLFLLTFYLENEGCKTPWKLFWCLICFPQHRTRLAYLAGQNCCNLLFLKPLPPCRISELCDTKPTRACRSGWLFSLLQGKPAVLLLACSCAAAGVHKWLKKNTELAFTGLRVDPSSTIWDSSRYCTEGCFKVNQFRKLSPAILKGKKALFLFTYLVHHKLED